MYCFGIDFIKNVCAKSFNNFWKNVFKSWPNVYHSTCENSAEFSSKHVWYNPKINVGGNSVFLKILFNVDIVFIYDILDANGNIYSFDYIESVPKSKINFIEYAGLKKAIQERRALLQAFIKPPLPIIPATIAIFFKDKKGCKDMYRQLVNNNKCKIKSISKWEELEI